MYSTEIATFLGAMQKLSVDEYMLYSVVLLQGCGLMYKVVMWRLGCRRKKQKIKDPESLLDRVVVVQAGGAVDSQKKHSGQAHSITTDTTDTTSSTVKTTV